MLRIFVVIALFLPALAAASSAVSLQIFDREGTLVDLDWPARAELVWKAGAAGGAPFRPALKVWIQYPSDVALAIDGKAGVFTREEKTSPFPSQTGFGVRSLVVDGPVTTLPLSGAEWNAHKWHGLALTVHRVTKALVIHPSCEDLQLEDPEGTIGGDDTELSYVAMSCRMSAHHANVFLFHRTGEQTFRVARDAPLSKEIRLVSPGAEESFPLQLVSAGTPKRAPVAIARPPSPLHFRRTASLSIGAGPSYLTFDSPRAADRFEELNVEVSSRLELPIASDRLGLSAEARATVIPGSGEPNVGSRGTFGAAIGLGALLFRTRYGTLSTTAGFGVTGLQRPADASPALFGPSLALSWRGLIWGSRERLYEIALEAAPLGASFADLSFASRRLDALLKMSLTRASAKIPWNLFLRVSNVSFSSAARPAGGSLSVATLGIEGAL